MRLFALLAACLMLLTWPAAPWAEPVRLQQESAAILVQIDSPLRIDTYRTEYLDEGRTDAIRNTATLRNNTRHEVETFGVQMRFVDAEGRDMRRPHRPITDRTIAPFAAAEFQWEHRPGIAEPFADGGKGVIFLEYVRLSDGTVWRHDPDSVEPQFANILSSLQARD